MKQNSLSGRRRRSSIKGFPGGKPWFIVLTDEFERVDMFKISVFIFKRGDSTGNMGSLTFSAWNTDI